MASNNSTNNNSANGAAFLAYLGSSDANVTGNGGVYTLGSGVNLTVAFDITSSMNVNGTFTAPKTGHYLFCTALQFTGLAMATSLQLSIVTTGKTYSNTISRGLLSGDIGHTLTVCVAMSLGDTAMVTGMVDGEMGNTADALGDTNPVCFFSGKIIY